MATPLSVRLGLNLYPIGSNPFRRGEVDADHRALDSLVAIDRQGPLADRPAPAVAFRGVYWTVTDGLAPGVTSRCDGAEWRVVNGPRIRPWSHTFTVTGDVQLPAGDAFYVPPFPIRAPAGLQTASYAGAHLLLRSGTCTVQLVRITPAGARTILAGPVEVTGVAKVVTPVQPIALADLDLVALEVSALGVVPPRNLSATAFVDYRS